MLGRYCGIGLELLVLIMGLIYVGLIVGVGVCCVCGWLVLVCYTALGCLFVWCLDFEL